MEVAGLILLGGVAFFGASALIGRARITVFEYERGLWFRNGRFRRVLGLRVQKIDVRETPAAVTGQEVLTADGVPIKASVVGSYAVAEADRAILGPDDYRSAVYSELQLARRAGCDSDEDRRFARATIRALWALERDSPPRDCGRSVSICRRRRFAISRSLESSKRSSRRSSMRVRKGSRLSKRLEGRQRHCGTWRTPRR
jgi:hypothetical protein